LYRTHYLANELSEMTELLGQQFTTCVPAIL